MIQFIEYQNHRYPVVKIRKQEWMLENLQSEHYNDGTPIQQITNAIQWKEEAYRIYSR